MYIHRFGSYTDLLLGLLQQPVDERLVDDLVRVLVRVPVCWYCVVLRRGWMDLGGTMRRRL